MLRSRKVDGRLHGQGVECLAGCVHGTAYEKQLVSMAGFEPTVFLHEAETRYRTRATDYSTTVAAGTKKQRETSCVHCRVRTRSLSARSRYPTQAVDHSTTVVECSVVVVFLFSSSRILLGYEGQTNTLKLVGTGDGGLEELADELNSSKVMYAVIRVTDPKTTRTKYVLINWVGEACPVLRKGICSRHLHDVKGLLKGVHVTLNARNEEEVESEQVFAALAKSTATSYDFSERSEHEDRSAPVGTNYQRTNPLSEINTSSRNKFWEQQELEEQSRKQQEIKKKQQEEQLIEQERRKNELTSSSTRDLAVQERSAKTAASRRASEVADERVRAAAAAGGVSNPTVEEAEKEEQERVRRAELMRRERKQEAESIIGSSTKSARSLFEQCPAASASRNGRLSKPPPRKLKDFTPLNSGASSSDQSSTSNRGAVAKAWPPPSNSSGAPVQEERRPRQLMFRDGSNERTTTVGRRLVASILAPVASGRLSPVGAAQAPSATNPLAASYSYEDKATFNARESEQLYEANVYEAELSPTTNVYESETPSVSNVYASKTSASNVYESEPYISGSKTPASNVYESKPYVSGSKTPASNVYESEPVVSGSKTPASNLYESEPYVSGSKTSSRANMKQEESSKVPMFPPKHEQMSSHNFYESEPILASKVQPPSRGALANMYESEPPVSAMGQLAMSNVPASSVYENQYSVERSTHGSVGSKTNLQQQHAAVGAVNSNGGNYHTATNGPTEHRYETVPVEYGRVYDEPEEDYVNKGVQSPLYQTDQVRAGISTLFYSLLGKMIVLPIIQIRLELVLPIKINSFFLELD
ncbi:Actin-depolymerizing factor domain [Trinorchestia longiramus]|nr:Actin-depolymerizing factor domain [Trinorchestia longiramus]